MNKSNRFKELSAALKGEEPLQEKEVSPAPVKARTRNRGKRSNPDYEQVGVYIQRDLHLEVKKRLITEPEHDFSDLVNELLEGWLSARIE
jgi:hypothetical protein